MVSISYKDLLHHLTSKDSFASSLKILAEGPKFEYDDYEDPCALITVDAHATQSTPIKSYAGGAAIVMKATGFVANMSEVSSGLKGRDNKNRWITGAIPGVTFFRNISDGEREYLLHRNSVQIVYMTVEHSLFWPWADEYARRNRGSVGRAAEHRRTVMKRGGVALSSSGPVPSAPLLSASAHPRQRSSISSHSRSRSAKRPKARAGCEVPPPAVDGFASNQHVRNLGSAEIEIKAEPDRRGRRCFNRSDVIHLQNNIKGWTIPTTTARASDLSTSALLSMQNRHRHQQQRANHDTDIVELVEDARLPAQAAQAQQAQAQANAQGLLGDGRRLCEDCATIFTKSELTKYHRKYYCDFCYAKLDEVPCQGIGCTTILPTKKHGKMYNHGLYCIPCYDDWNMPILP